MNKLGREKDFFITPRSFKKEDYHMSSIKQYLKFVAPYKWKILWTVIIGVFKFAIPLLIPLILKYVIDNIITTGALTDVEKTSKHFWLMGGSFIVLLDLRTRIELSSGSE